MAVTELWLRRQRRSSTSCNVGGSVCGCKVYVLEFKGFQVTVTIIEHSCQEVNKYDYVNPSSTSVTSVGLGV